MNIENIKYIGLNSYGETMYEDKDGIRYTELELLMNKYNTKKLKGGKNEKE